MPAKGERQALPTRPIRRRAETTESLLPITCVCVCPRPRPPAPLFWAKSCVCVCVCMCVCVCVCACVCVGRTRHPAHVRVKRRVRRYARFGATDGSAAACWGWPRVPMPTLCVCLRIRRDTSTTDSPPNTPLQRPALSAHVFVYVSAPFAPPPPPLFDRRRGQTGVFSHGRCCPLQL